MEVEKQERQEKVFVLFFFFFLFFYNTLNLSSKHFVYCILTPNLILCAVCGSKADTGVHPCLAGLPTMEQQGVVAAERDWSGMSKRTF